MRLSCWVGKSWCEVAVSRDAPVMGGVIGKVLGLFLQRLAVLVESG